MSTRKEIRQLAPAELEEAWIYPAKHFVATDEDTQNAIDDIRRDLEIRHAQLLSMGKELEAYRLKQRTEYDLEMLQQAGFCPGIENYSRFMDVTELLLLFPTPFG